MMETLRHRCEALIEELGLAGGRRLSSVEPLTGGVASDIAVVDLEGEKICVKFALPKLKVAEDWQAPVHRNRAEFEWLSVTARIAPENSLRMFGRSDRQHGFAMEFLDGAGTVLWKSELLAGHDVPARATAVGDLLGRVHDASSRPGFGCEVFANRDDFHALRIEPYLVFTAGRHPEAAAELTRLAADLYRAETVLVHGDVSPKNIMFREDKPLLLDAECATMGAPEFDVAFCLNHLVLKAQHVPVLRAGLSGAAAGFWNAYRPHVSWEAERELEQRVCKLLPALMLARIDGKSPVEYLNEANGSAIREMSLGLLQAPENTLDGLIGRIATNWKDLSS